jgi:hypothetical protein
MPWSALRVVLRGSSAIAATPSCLRDSVNYYSAEILAAQEHFGFARPTAIEKDWHILRAMGAIASTDASQATLKREGIPYERLGATASSTASPPCSRGVNVHYAD